MKLRELDQSLGTLPALIIVSIGAMLIVVLSNGLILTGVSDIWQQVIKGLVIIGAVALDRARLVRGTRA